MLGCILIDEPPPVCLDRVQHPKFVEGNWSLVGKQLGTVVIRSCLVEQGGVGEWDAQVLQAGSQQHVIRRVFRGTGAL